MDRKEYSARMGFEHELIDRRLGWLLTSETILLAAYGLAFDQNILFLKLVALGGLGISGAVLLGILAAHEAKYCIWEDFLKSGESDKDEQFWVRTAITRKAFFTERAFPVVFALIWLALLILDWGPTPNPQVPPQSPQSKLEHPWERGDPTERSGPRFSGRKLRTSVQSICEANGGPRIDQQGFPQDQCPVPLFSSDLSNSGHLRLRVHPDTRKGS